MYTVHVSINNLGGFPLNSPLSPLHSMNHVSVCRFNLQKDDNNNNNKKALFHQMNKQQDSLSDVIKRDNG